MLVMCTLYPDVESRCELSATLYFLNQVNAHTCDLNTKLKDYKLFQSFILYHHDKVICTLHPYLESTCEESATVSLSQGYVYTCEHNSKFNNWRILALNSIDKCYFVSV